jgi:hypothetical protein
VRPCACLPHHHIPHGLVAGTRRLTGIHELSVAGA